MKSKLGSTARPRNYGEREEGRKNLRCNRQSVPTFRLSSESQYDLESSSVPTTVQVTLVVPPAIPVMTSLTVEAQVFGLRAAVDARLIVCQKSVLLLEHQLTPSEISTGKICVKLPAVPEGMITFLLIAEDGTPHTSFHTVPCCVVPPKVVQDIRRMFTSMCSVAKESEQLPHDVNISDEDTLVWVWKEHFCSFLEDVDKLFEIDRISGNSGTRVLDILTLMLQECFKYNAWEFAAYLLAKATAQGIKILSNDFLGTKKITPERLKAIVLLQEDS